MQPPALTDISDFLALTDKIGTAGQPTREQFPLLKQAGYEVVVNLLPAERYTLPDEKEVVTGLGMEYVNIPVEWAAPTDQDLDRFFEVMDAQIGRRVFVHCARNMRVSAFLFLYRVLRLGMDETDAEDEMERIWVPSGVWRELIDRNLRERQIRKV